MDSYDETLHGRYLTSSSSSAVNRDPTRQWFYKSFEPNLESAIVNTPAAAAAVDDASQIMHITDTTAFPSPDDVAAATAAVAKNKRKKNRKRKQEHDQIRKSTSTTLKNKRIMKETNRDSMATLQPQQFADTSVTAIAGTVPTTDVINIGNVTPVETAIIATNTSYTSSADTPYLIDQLMNSYDEVVSSYSTTDQHPSVQWFYNSFGKDIGSSTTTTSTAATDGDNSSQPITVHDNTAASNTTSAGTAAASSFFLPGNEGATTTASTINMADIATVIEDKCRGSKKRKQTIKPLKVSKKKKQKRDEIQFSRESATTTSSSSSNPGIIASIGGNVMQVETSVAKASNMSPIFPSQIASSTQHFPVYHLQNDDLQNTAETTTTTTTMTSTIAAAVDTDFVPPSFSSSSSSSPSSVYSISEIVAKIEAAIGGEEATVGDRAVVVSSGDITTSNNDDDNNNNNRLRLESLNEHLITLCQWKTMIKNQNPILPDIHIVRTIDGEYSFDLYLCYDDPNRVMYLAQPIALRSRKSKLKLAIRVITGLMTSELLYSITILRRPCSLMELKSAFLKLTADEPSNQHMLCLQRNVPYPYKIL